MARKITVLAAVIAACLFSSVQAWKYQGHILVARMAYDILQKENPRALQGAENVLSALAGQTITSSEDKYPFVECASFADMVKYKGGGWQSNWHFVDIPYFDQGGNLKDYPQFKLDTHNITEHIPNIVDWLSDKPNHQDSFTYQTIYKNNYQNETRARSYALRLLIHYLGDIHQPMHSISRVNAEFPAGDRGGNSFPLKTHYSASELHAVWDSVIYEFHVNDKLPYDEASWTKLGNSVNGLRARFNPDPAKYKTMNVPQWAQDTFVVGSKNAYNGAVMNSTLPQDYIDKNNELAVEQLVIASIRLAMVIEQIFGTAKTVEQEAPAVSFLQ